MILLYVLLFDPLVISSSNKEHQQWQVYTKRQQAVELVRRLCKAMECLRAEEPRDIYADAIQQAASSGNHEVVKAILETFPRAIACVEPSTGLNILQIAIEKRFHRVFSVYQMGGYRHLNLEK